MAWDGTWQIEFDDGESAEPRATREIDGLPADPGGASASGAPRARPRRRTGVLALTWAVCGVVIGLAAGSRSAPPRPTSARAGAVVAQRPSTGLPDSSAALAMAGAAQSRACGAPR